MLEVERQLEVQLTEIRLKNAKTTLHLLCSIPAQSRGSRYWVGFMQAQEHVKRLTTRLEELKKE